MSDERFIIEPVEIINCDTEESRFSEVITDIVETYSYEDFVEICEKLNELASENEELKKERDYCETSSKHRQRLLEDAEKEIRLHNAYLIDNNQAEDYQRWRRSNK